MTRWRPSANGWRWNQHRLLRSWKDPYSYILRCNKLLSAAFGLPTVRGPRSRGNQTRDNYTSHRSPGVREIANESATARGDRIKQQVKQAVWPLRVVVRLLFSAEEDGCFIYMLYSLLVFAVFPCFSMMPGTKETRQKFQRR